jgi:putative ABC transport system substrate-binding protein
MGQTEGRDFSVEVRWAHSSNARLSSLAAELVAISPAAIIAEGTRGAEAVAEATSTIPVVAPSIGENAAIKLGGSGFNRPVRNITGIIGSPRSVIAKLFEVAVELVPGATRLGLLGDEVLETVQMPVARATAIAMRATLVDQIVASAEDLGPAVERLSTSAQAVIVPSSAMFRAERRHLASLFASARLPAVYDNKVIVDAGGLASYGVDTVASFRRAAYFVDRVLHGATAADLPLEEPSPLFAINMKAAKALGLMIPPTLLARADEVIE